MRRALSMTARRIQDVNGQDAGTIVISRDVTTEELALRAREDLVASVSHELRTPLTSIIGYLDLALDEESLAPTARRSLEVAERNASRLLELVSDILTASAESRQGLDLTVTPQMCDLSEVVMASIEAVIPPAGERRITIDASGVEPATAFADPHRIRQVMDNLLSNAVKYNDDGGHIEVGLTSDGLHVWIIVRDDGPGISEQELPRLFERFFRADAVRKTTTHGSGLGLAITRDIVRASGGEITVQTRAGEGATFIVRLPATDPRGEA
jgi:signal transduction histidine kinase